VLCELPRGPDGGGLEASATWFRLLLRGWDPETKRATSPAVDCTGAQVRWEAPALACEDASTSRALLPDRPLSGEDVVVTPFGEDFRLVWIVTNRFASGDALGPAAIVEVKSRRLVVRAIGALRANPLRARLGLERLGATEALLAEGEQCASADPSSCERAVRVMPLLGGRFQPTRLETEAGACAGPAWFRLAREESERLPNGWRRRYRLDGALASSPEGIDVREAVVVHDLDPRQPNAPPRLFRSADASLRVRLQDGRLVTSGGSLWTRMMEARN